VQGVPSLSPYTKSPPSLSRSTVIRTFSDVFSPRPMPCFCSKLHTWPGTTSRRKVARAKKGVARNSGTRPSVYSRPRPHRPPPVVAVPGGSAVSAGAAFASSHAVPPTCAAATASPAANAAPGAQPGPAAPSGTAGRARGPRGPRRRRRRIAEGLAPPHALRPAAAPRKAGI